LAGEAAAADAIAGEMLAPVYRFCLYRLGGDADLCQDVVQETLLKALECLNEYEPARCGNSIYPWLTGLARNEIRRALARTPSRSAHRLQEIWSGLDEDLRRLYSGMDSQAFQDELLQRDQTRQLVNAAMSQLPPRYGEALEAKYLLGQSVEQIAHAWQTTEKAVESQLTRARRAFREVFLSLSTGLGGIPMAAKEDGP
jgi:RNA polymerase sigma-70 factor (ECF subfamily)